MKQYDIFGNIKEDEDSQYTSKIKTPIYKPTKLKAPHIMELFDKRKYSKIIAEINRSNVNENEKEFLRLAATRHIVFNYENIAEYYSHAKKETQELMENSALVIIDFNKAIEKGYIKLTEDIAKLYGEDYGNE